jgi:5-methyltetrahydrofolate--homocysteine methyltransferase
MESLLNEIFDAIIDGDDVYVRETVQEALDAGIPAVRILDHGLIAAMGEVGALFEEGEYFVPEMVLSSRAMKAGLAVLRPHLAKAAIKPLGRVITATIQDDLHDIGKNLVGILLEGAGFEVQDLGVDVSPERLVAVVRANQVDIVALSTLLMTTMPNLRLAIEALEVAGLRDRVRVMVGGAPVTDRFSRQIGADGYAPDAYKAVALARSLLS